MAIPLECVPRKDEASVTIDRLKIFLFTHCMYHNTSV